MRRRTVTRLSVWAYTEVYAIPSRPCGRLGRARRASLRNLELRTLRVLGRGGVSAGVLEGKEFLAGTAGKVYLVPAVGPFVPRGLAGVVHADDLLAFSQALEVPVGGGDPDIRALREAR